MPTLDPMKLMMADEFGSTAAPEISWFQRLALLKGRNPLRLAPWPALIALQALWLLPPPLPPEPMLEPLSPPPQSEQARARASTPVAAGSLFQVTLMPLLSQETRVKPCDVRSSPA